MYSKFSFGEVYRRIYVWKCSYTAFSDHISDDIPPQIKILNMVIPILMHLGNLISILSVTS